MESVLGFQAFDGLVVAVFVVMEAVYIGREQCNGDLDEFE